METGTWSWFGAAVLSLSFALHGVSMIAVAIAAHRGRRRPPSRRQLQAPSAGAPKRPTRVSVLKPLAGRDDELRSNLESFAHLSHPHHEILLGVASLSDPALADARAFLSAHPELDTRIVLTDPNAATNPKVAQLLGLSAAATGDLLVISDSNVRVARDYLESIEDVFDRGPHVGLVTNLFVGSGERSLGAALENLQLTTFATPAVIASELLSSAPLTVGKSMAIRRNVLEAIGGFGAVGGVLAEDHLLGRLVRRAGYRVGLSFAVVENRNVDCGATRTIERHTRWAKMRRNITPGMFALEPLADPLVMAALLAFVCPSRLMLAAFAIMVPVKTFTGWLALWLLRGRTLPLHYVTAA